MGGGVQGRGGGRAPIVGINITPMVDVVLVLLIIMMVSATYIVSQSMKVNLPKAANSETAAGSTAIVTLTREGQILLNEAPTDETQLEAALRRARREHSDVTVVISADAQSQHGRVVRVMDIAKSVGIVQFAINVERRASP